MVISPCSSPARREGEGGGLAWPDRWPPSQDKTAPSGPFPGCWGCRRGLDSEGQPGRPQMW